MNIGREIGIVRIVEEPQAVTEPVEEPAAYWTTTVVPTAAHL